MSEPLATTCAGWSLQKVGGRCPRREDCRRYIHRRKENTYPQEDFLCAVGKWEWHAPAPSWEKPDA